MSEEKRPQEQAPPPREEKPEFVRDPDELAPTATWPAGRYWEITLPPEFDRPVRTRRA
jgi:hypothetical protein